MSKKPETYKVGGGWGDAIEWTIDSIDRFKKGEGEVFKVAGWKQRKPRIGDKLVGEFENSVIEFEFTKIKPCGNPADMFFAEVKLVKQTMRERV